MIRFLAQNWPKRCVWVSGLFALLLSFATSDGQASGAELIYSVQNGEVRSLSVDPGAGANQPYVYFGEFKNNTGAILRVPEGAAPLTVPSPLFENLSVLDSTMQIPGSYEFDSLGRIYFSYGGYVTHIIGRGPKDGSTASTTLFSVSGGHFYGLIGDDLYYMTNFSKFWKRPNYGTGAPELLLDGYWIRTFALNNGIYFFQNYSNKQYYRFDTVTRALTGSIFPGTQIEAHIFADDRYVYRIMNGNIDRTLNSGGGPVERIVTGSENVLAMLFDNENVYYSTASGIYTFPRDSAAPAGIKHIVAANSPNLKATSANYLYWSVSAGSESKLYRLAIPVVTDPVADAGPDQTVNEGEAVTLNAGGSSAPNGGTISYLWTQVGGPAVNLSNATSPSPSFHSPFVATSQVLSFQLTVTDAHGNSVNDFVDVSVIQYNDPPVADAGLDGTVKEGAARMLDGSASWDNNGESIASYQWSQISGPAVALIGDTSSTPTFLAPAGTAGQFVTFSLIVSDGKEPSTADTVAINIVANSAPVAAAGTDQTKDEGTVVTLDGTASSDPDIGDVLSYAWQQTGGPAVNLQNASTQVATFNAPAVSGSAALTFELVVTDDDATVQKSDNDSVTVNVRDVNAPPSCDLAVASSPKLWPPDHRMEAVSINGVTDNDQTYNAVAISVTGVTQDEPVRGTGDGDSSPDATIVSGGTADSALLRRERSGTGNGRVFTVNFTASDGFESCSGAVKVSVQHSRNGTGAVDDGQAFNSTAP